MTTSRHSPQFVTLIPGIDGNGVTTFPHWEKTFEQLASNIKLATYNDPRVPRDSRIKTPNSYMMHDRKLDILQIIEDITQKMSHVAPDAANILLVGYSFGAILAFAAGQALIQQGYQVSLCILDAPAPDITKNYFKMGNKSATTTLLRIMDYIASTHCKIESAKLPSNNYQRTADIEALSKLSLVSNVDKDQIWDIYEKTVAQLGKYDARTIQLHAYTTIIAKNLYEFINYFAIPPKSFDSITVLTTPETRKQYKCGDSGGWEKYSANCTSFPLTEGTHTSILDRENSATLLKKMLAALAIPARINTPPVTTHSAMTKSVVTHHRQSSSTHQFFHSPKNSSNSSRMEDEAKHASELPLSTLLSYYMIDEDGVDDASTNQKSSILSYPQIKSALLT